MEMMAVIKYETCSRFDYEMLKLVLRNNVSCCISTLKCIEDGNLILLSFRSLLKLVLRNNVSCCIYSLKCIEDVNMILLSFRSNAQDFFDSLLGLNMSFSYEIYLIVSQILGLIS
jgi:hypothetical protein